MHELAPYLRLYKKHWFSLSLGMLLALATLVASIGLLRCQVGLLRQHLLQV